MLTYEKGAAVLRMLEQYLGAERFHAGVQAYLAKHAYGNTENTDLWDTIEAVTSEPVRRIMDAWIFQGGYPLVRASLLKAGRRSVSQQRRFVYSDLPDTTQWPVPIHVRQSVTAPPTRAACCSTRSTSRSRFSTRMPRCSPTPADTGSFGSATRRRLLDRLAGPTLAAMSTIERYNLIDDAWAAVVAGEASARGVPAARPRVRRRDDAARLAGAVRAGSASAIGCSTTPRPGSSAHSSAAWPVRRCNGSGGLRPRVRTISRASSVGCSSARVAIVGNDRDVQEKARTLYKRSLDEPGSVAPPVASTPRSRCSRPPGMPRTTTTSSGVRDVDRTRRSSSVISIRSPSSARPELMARTCELTLSDRVRSQNAPFLSTLHAQPRAR